MLCPWSLQITFENLRGPMDNLSTPFVYVLAKYLEPFELNYVYKLKTSFSVYYLMSRTNKNLVTYGILSATSIAQEFDLIVDSLSKVVKL